MALENYIKACLLRLWHPKLYTHALPLISAALPARPPVLEAGSPPAPLPATCVPLGGSSFLLSCNCSSVIVVPLVAAGGHGCLVALLFFFLTSAPDPGPLL